MRILLEIGGMIGTGLIMENRASGRDLTARYCLFLLCDTQLTHTCMQHLFHICNCSLYVGSQKH